jgi:hypothetical protein
MSKENERNILYVVAIALLILWLVEFLVSTI